VDSRLPWWRNREAAKKALDAAHIYMAIDVAKMIMIDGTGIGTLTNLQKAMKERGEACIWWD